MSRLLCCLILALNAVVFLAIAVPVGLAGAVMCAFTRNDGRRHGP